MCLGKIGEGVWEIQVSGYGMNGNKGLSTRNIVNDTVRVLHGDTW